jgi:SAM-dependent methyltransferase
MKILNLGCGHKTSADPRVINIDWSAYLRIRKNIILSTLAPFLMTESQRKKLNALPPKILVHDLSKGIPFEESTVDVVFHSNMLEHLDKADAIKFLREVLRVLKPSGIHRIVVPDFELVAARYLSHIKQCDENELEIVRHEDYISAILEQSVRRRAAGTILHSPLRGWFENWFFGDARSRGETHQWMSDRISLGSILRDLGYVNIRLHSFDKSAIPEWNALGLDLNLDGSEYAEGSIYIEAQKFPAT